jgi:hypothetical protein
MVDGGAGKGCRYRPVDKERYDREYERIYGVRGAIKRAQKAMAIGYKIAPFNGKRKVKV